MRYADAKPDMSGSRTKNRMRVEVLWGLDRLLELMKQDGDFAVVFDYLCDVELHLEDAIEFHQVKTKKRKHFDYQWLCGEDASKNSVMVTLYRLKEVLEPGKTTKLLLVANRPLVIGREQVAPVPGVFTFARFPERAAQRIRESIASRLEVDELDIDLQNISYRYEELALGERGKDAVLGKLTRIYEKVMGEECNRPNALFKILEDLAQDRATAEEERDSLDQVIDLKGITRYEVGRIFAQHGTRSNCALERTFRWIESLPPAKQRGLKRAIEEVVQIRYRSPLWKNVLSTAREALSRDANASLTASELVELIAKECPELFNVEMTDALKTAWASLALFHCLEE